MKERLATGAFIGIAITGLCAMLVPPTIPYLLGAFAFGFGFGALIPPGTP